MWPEDGPPTAAGLRHWMESEPERAHFRLWVVEDDSRLVAFGECGFHWSMSTPGIAWSWVGVQESHRGQGLGGALLDRCEEHLRAHGVRKLESFASQGSGGDAFLERRGYRRTRMEMKQVLDLGAVDLSAVEEHLERKAVEGYTLAPLAAFADRPREVHAVYAAATADIPADDPEDDVRFEDWEAQDLGDPELTREGSFLVVHEGQPVALAFLLVNDEAKIGNNEMTGTLAEFRGRGLARLAKLASIRWAKEQGLTALYTGNDFENAPMLALNRSLGYEVRWRRLFYAKQP